MREVSIGLPGELGVLPRLIVAHDERSLLLPGPASPLLGLLTFIGLVDERPTRAPHPTHEHAIHEQYNQQLHDLMATWGERSPRFQRQQSSHQEERHPDLPPSRSEEHTSELQSQS